MFWNNWNKKPAQINITINYNITAQKLPKKRESKAEKQTKFQTTSLSTILRTQFNWKTVPMETSFQELNKDVNFAKELISSIKKMPEYSRMRLNPATVLKLTPSKLSNQMTTALITYLSGKIYS